MEDRDARKIYSKRSAYPKAVEVFLSEHTAKRAPRVLVRHDIGIIADLIARRPDPLAHIVVLGARERLVISAHLIVNLAAVKAVKYR